MGYVAPGMTTPPRGRFDWNAFTEGFDLTAKNWTHFVAFALVALVVQFGVSMGGQFINTVLMSGDSAASIGLFIGSAVISWLLQMGLNYVMYGGVLQMGYHAMSGEQVEVGQGFRALNKFGKLLGVGVLTALATVPIIAVFAVLFMGPIIGAAALQQGNSEAAGAAIGGAIGGMVCGGIFAGVAMLYITGRLWLASAAVVYEDYSPLDAIKRSWELTSRCQGQMMLWLLAGGLLMMVGYLMCCLPYLFALPVTLVATGVLYRDLAEIRIGGGSQTFATPYPRQYGTSMPGYGGPPAPEAQNPFPSPFESPSTPDPGDEPPRPSGPPPVPPPS